MIPPLPPSSHAGSGHQRATDATFTLMRGEGSRDEPGYDDDATGKKNKTTNARKKTPPNYSNSRPHGALGPHWRSLIGMPGRMLSQRGGFAPADGALLHLPISVLLKPDRRHLKFSLSCGFWQLNPQTAPTTSRNQGVRSLEGVPPRPARTPEPAEI